MLKVIVLRSILLPIACSLAIIARAAANPNYFDIPAGDLTAALESLAKQSGAEVVYQPVELKGLRTRGVSGILEPQAAATQLLEGTPLALHTDTTGVMLIAATSAHESEAPLPAEPQKHSISTDRRELTPDASNSLEEIVVTAQKRAESLQNVPISITALSSAELENRAVSSFMDYGTLVPNLGFGASGDGLAGSRSISIRGVGGNGTTGFYLDETPLPDSIDPRVVDIERIEVLRGPQGTLYGARSEGGTVRLISKQPDLDTIEANVHSGISDTWNTDRPNEVGDGSVSIPLISGQLALRAVAFYDYEAGYFKREFPTTPGGTDLTTIDNVARTITNGGALSLLWKVNDALSITPRVLTQKSEYNGFPFADATPTDLNPTNFVQKRLFNVPEGGFDQWTLSSLGVHYDTGYGELVSSTSYFDRTISETEDSSEVQSLYFLEPFGHAPAPFPITEIKPEHRFVQEIRFASAFTGPWQVVGGVFFNNTNGQFNPGYGDYLPIYYPGLSALTRYPSNLLFEQSFPTTVHEQAVFAEFSYQITNRVKLTVGGRWDEIKTTSGGIIAGLAEGFTLITPSTTEIDVSVDPKFQADFQLAANSMLYATAAKGFRPGGIVPALPLSPLVGCAANLATDGVTPSEAQRYKADSLWNYEIGSKNTWFGGRLTVDGAAFYMDWKNIQQEILLPCGFQFFANAGAAKSEGAEIEVHSRPLPSVDLSAGLGYVHAVITATSGALSPFEIGERVFQVPDWTGNLSGTFTNSFGAPYSGALTTTFSYVGESTSANNTLFDPRIRAPYSLLDSKYALRWSDYEIALVGKNLTNEHADLADNRSIAIELPGRPRVVTNQPRTIGLEFRAKFK